MPPEVAHLNLQLLQTIQTMKQEGLADDCFSSIYLLKEKIDDHFFLEVIPAFCSDTRDVLKSLAEMMIKQDDNWDYDQMLEYVYKIKGAAVSLLGRTSRMAEACSAFERAIINMPSKEECSKALHQAQREYEAVEAKLHICLTLERGIVLLSSMHKP
ncbi:hypothetical protein HN51_012946 [Arachis hypogaea]|nr:uncharacterized protein LOC114927528 [Arachis hypogaea]